MVLIIFCLQVSLACLAIYVSVNHQGMIFNFAKPYLDLIFHPVLQKPIYGCLTCMASFWTVLLWTVFNGGLQLELLFAILIVAGLNKLICAFLERSTEYGC